MNRDLLNARAFKVRSQCEDVEISPLRTIHELLESSHLLHENYIQPNPYKLLYLPQYFSKQNTLLTAKSNTKVIGTIGICFNRFFRIHSKTKY